MNERVLLIGHSGDMYGASRSLIKLAVILSKQRTVYIVLPESGPLYERLKQVIPEERIILLSGLYIFTRRSFRLKNLPSTVVQFLNNIHAIRDIIKKYEIAIIHTNSGVIPAPALAARLSRKKHIWHIREWFGDFKAFWPAYSAYMTRFSDRIICVSEAMASQFRNKKNVQVIYNGFPIPTPAQDHPSNLHFTKALQGADLVIGCTSRIRLIRKGQEYLIEALGILSKKNTQKIHAVFIGDYVPGYESQKEVLENLIQQYQLEDRIHFWGHLEDPLPVYGLFDIFVLASGEPEPFGGVVIEAMSMGLPVIGSNVGGTVEQIEDGWNGYLFENKDPDDLAAKIEKLAGDKQSLHIFGTRSRERVEQCFSLELHKNSILELYRSISNQNKQ